MKASLCIAAWAVLLPGLFLSSCGGPEKDARSLYADYSRDLGPLLTTGNKRVGKEIIKVEPLSDRFTVPQKLSIKGTPYEIGLAIGHIGKQAKARLPMLAENDRALNQRVIELYQRICPQYLEVVRGVADVYQQPMSRLDVGTFEYRFTSRLWCELLRNGRFYRLTDFGSAGNPFDNHHCSAASYYTNGHQFVGRNFDNASDRPHYFTTMEMTGTYKVMGHTIYGITSWTVDGINEKGLALCVTSVCGDKEPYPREPAVLMGHMAQIVMQTCANVDEAKKLLGSVRVWFPDEINHWLIADAAGNAVVVEWNPRDYKLRVFDKPGPYELLTNTPFEKGEEFLLANCARYRRGKPLLESGVHDSAEMLEVMKAMRFASGPVRTLWTSVMDLNRRSFEVRYFKEFERKYEFRF